MSLLTMEVPEEVLAMTATVEGMARAKAAVFAAFGIAMEEPAPLIVSDELYDSFLEILDGVEAGTIKTKPHDKAESLKRAEKLLVEASVS